MEASPTDRWLDDARWVRGFVRRLGTDRDDADDLSQDVIAVALSDRCAGRSRGWLATVARRLAGARWRRERIERRALEDLADSEPAPATDELVGAAELQQRAIAAVLALPEVYREAVLLRFVEGLSLDDVALRCGVPVETARTRQRRALAMVRERLGVARPRGRIAALLPALWIGGLEMKKVSAVMVALVVVFAGVLWWGPLVGDPSASRAGSGVEAETAELAGAAASRGDAEVLAVDPGRVAVASGASEAIDGSDAALAGGRLEVLLRWQDDGAPAIGQPILVRGEGWPAGRIRRTEADGRATFLVPESGRYRVLVMPGWRLEVVDVPEGGDAVHTLEVQRGLAVRGLVVDPRGAPVAGAEILGTAGGREPQHLLPLGVSDSGGRFVVEGLFRLALVGARHPRFGTSDLILLDPELRGDRGPRELRLELPGEPASLRGQVVDAEGVPVAGAWLRVGSRGRLQKPDAAGRVTSTPPPQTAQTDAAGRFHLQMLRAGTEPLVIQARGFALVAREVELFASRESTIDVRLRDEAVVDGVVRDPGGEPLAGVEVSCPDLGVLPRALRATTDADGRYAIPGLPHGADVHLRAERRGFVAARTTLQPAGDGRVTWSPTLERLAVLRGVLVDARGAPLDGYVIATDAGGRRATTAIDGRFALEVPSGPTLDVVVRRTFGFEPILARFAGLRVGAGDVELRIVDAQRPSARLRGRCLGPDDAPLGGIEVSLKQGDWPVIPGGKLVKTAADGRFETPDLPPGTYRVHPSSAGLTFDNIDVEVAPHERRDLGDLRGR